MNMPRLILPSELESVGQDRRKLVSLCNKGELTRLRRGVYLTSSDFQDLRPLQQYGLKALAFQQLAPRQPVLCHATAALLWGLWIVGTPQRLHVMTAVTRGGRTENGVVRHRGSMTEGVLQCGPFLLKDRPTTAMQLILDLPFPYAVAVCDASLRAPNREHHYNEFTPADTEPPSGEPRWQSTYQQGTPLRLEELTAAADRLPSKAATVRAMAVINFASALSGSAGESISRAKMHMYGFPVPILQRQFTLRDGSDAFVDFQFEQLRLAGEFGGKEKYLRAGWSGGLSIQERVLKEKQREDQIRAQGVGFVRWTWAEMLNRERFIYLLRQARLRQK